MTTRVCSAIVLALCAASQSNAQTYPVKPVRMIVPYTASGSVDLLARLMAPKLSESLGQQVIVDNRPGAAGNIGTEAVVRAPPDGYTIVMITVPLVLNPSLYEKLPFDAVRDLAPVSLLAAAAYVLIVHPSVPVRSVKELIALAKKEPDKVLYASGGKGTNSHIAFELFRYLTGTRMLHVPYKGGGPEVIGLLSGESETALLAVDVAAPHIRAGRFRALATSTRKRLSSLPELPTVAEAGVPGYDFTTWYGLLAPAATPASTIKVLNEHVVTTMRAADLTERLARQNIDVVASSPAELASHIRTELARWPKVVKAMGLRAD